MFLLRKAVWRAKWGRRLYQKTDSRIANNRHDTGRGIYMETPGRGVSAGDMPRRAGAESRRVTTPTDVLAYEKLRGGGLCLAWRYLFIRLMQSRKRRVFLPFAALEENNAWK